MDWCIIWIVVAVYTVNLYPSLCFEGLLREYCSVEIFNPQCGRGEVIKVTHAEYGRMKIGKCVKADYGRLGCAVDILQLLDKLCSGSETCTVEIVKLETVVELACIGELKAYLEASYICQKVYQVEVDTCSSQYIVEVESSVEILSSSTSKEKKCGFHDSPWLLKAQPGQQIKLGLTDFSWNNNSDPRGCVLRYGYILDTESDDVINICGGGRSKQRNLYLSRGYSVQVVLDENAVNNHKFLLSLEAIGCPNFEAPPHSWTEEVNGSLIVNCQSSSQTWTLKCVENKWLGIMGKCDPLPSSTAVTPEVKIVGAEKRKLPNVSGNHVIAFGLGCLTLIICCSVVVIGYYCTRRYVIKCEGKLEKHQLASQYFPSGTVVRIKTNPRNLSTKPSSASTDLPPYSAPLPKEQRPPPVPHRTSSYRGDMSESMMSDYLAPQSGDDNSVKYYILENPAESGGKEEMYQSIHLFSSLERAPEVT